MRLNTTLGPKMYKSLYRAYTDESFNTRIESDPTIGIMGPTIHAQARLSC